MYLSFTAMILSLFIENSPYIDMQLFLKYDQPSYDLGSSYFEMDFDMTYSSYFENDSGMIYDYEQVGDTISNGVGLTLESNYNMYELSHLTIDTYVNRVDILLTYDDCTITVDYRTYIYLFNRENETVGYYSINQTFTAFKEIYNETPFIYSEELYSLTTLRLDFRGYTPDDYYQQGYSDGYNDGEREGYDNGYSEGYNDGEYVGSMTQPIFKLFNAVFRSIDMVLQTEVLPGIKLWYIVSIPLVFLIIQFFINLWR